MIPFRDRKTPRAIDNSHGDPRHAREGADQVIREQIPSGPDIRSGNRSHAPARNSGGSAEEQWLYAPLGAADRPGKNGRVVPKQPSIRLYFQVDPDG